jgi:hypothetical protein
MKWRVREFIGGLIRFAGFAAVRRIGELWHKEYSPYDLSVRCYLLNISEFQFSVIPWATPLFREQALDRILGPMRFHTLRQPPHGSPSHRYKIGAPAELML